MQHVQMTVGSLFRHADPPLLPSVLVLLVGVLSHVKYRVVTDVPPSTCDGLICAEAGIKGFLSAYFNAYRLVFLLRLPPFLVVVCSCFRVCWFVCVFGLVCKCQPRGPYRGHEVGHIIVKVQKMVCSYHVPDPYWRLPSNIASSVRQHACRVTVQDQHRLHTTTSPPPALLTLPQQ